MYNNYQRKYEEEKSSASQEYYAEAVYEEDIPNTIANMGESLT
jgi:hypothetical protein